MATSLVGITAATASHSSNELRGVCEAIARELPQPRSIRDRNGVAYLDRYYLVGGPKSAAPWDARGNPRPGIVWADLPINVYLHHIRGDDERAALHSHPWTSAVSIILAGGYAEDRLDALEAEVTRSVVRPLSTNVLRRSDFHRIELAEKDSWSLFVTGRPVGDWYFYDLAKQRRVHWREWK